MTTQRRDQNFYHGEIPFIGGQKYHQGKKFSAHPKKNLPLDNTTQEGGKISYNS